MSASAPARPSRLGRVLQVAVLGLVALAVYWPALRGELLWDDDNDLLHNPLLRDLPGLAKIWFRPTTFDYYPIKFSVQWLQWQLWGEHVAGYHLTNVALHLAAALLFWRVLGRLGVRLAWFGALLFTVHPLAVESVAWICELKNTLSLPTLLLAVIAWLDHERAPRGPVPWAAAGWFAGSMLTKTSGVMLPCALLLVAIWQHGRVRRADWIAAAPLFGVSLALGLVTIWFQFDRSIGTTAIPVGGGAARLALAGSTLAFYAGKALWPLPLLPIYPRWPVDPPAAWLFLPWLVALVPGVWLWRNRARWPRHLLLGLGWFALHLAPFLGLLTISYMRFTWAMDHMAYVALLGPIGLAAAGLGVARDRARPRAHLALTGAAAGLVVFFAALAHRHAAHFRNSEVFWKHALDGNPTAAPAHNNLALALAKTGRAAEAIAHLRTALELEPDYFEARTNLGNVLHTAGRDPEALDELRAAARQRPKFADTHFNLALALSTAGQPQEALAALDIAVRLRPDWPQALDARAVLLRQLGRAEDARRDLLAALRLEPDFPDAHNDLALLLGDAGHPAEAIAELEHALRLKPDYAEAHNNLGIQCATLDRAAEAIGHFQRALELKPGYADAQFNLGMLLLRTGQTIDAVPHLEATVRRRPDSLGARFNLGTALIALGRNAEAIPQFESALRLDATHPEIPDCLGVALANTGRPADAVPHYEEALRRREDYAPAHLHLALALARLGRQAEARVHHARALALDPATPAMAF